MDPINVKLPRAALLLIVEALDTSALVLARQADDPARMLVSCAEKLKRSIQMSNVADAIRAALEAPRADAG